MNEPIKNCTTCAHYISDEAFQNKRDQFRFGRCARFGKYNEVALKYDCQLNYWHSLAPLPPPPPPKPRRSLRQWLYDTFWK